MTQPLGKIITLEDKLDGHRLEEWLVALITAGYDRVTAAQCLPFIEAQEFAPVAVQAEVNAGRWIVRCPTCSGAQPAYRTRHAFWCVSCLQSRFGGRWTQVIWPEVNDVTRIERILMQRPAPTMRNWTNESIADLLRENAEHGDSDGGVTA